MSHEFSTPLQSWSALGSWIFLFTLFGSFILLTESRRIDSDYLALSSYLLLHASPVAGITLGLIGRKGGTLHQCMSWIAISFHSIILTLIIAVKAFS